jgi:hypothetical protein
VGFLDQSTNNIILDAVLTDKGRELLANGAGSFSISKFAFADDEVNYDMINQFGRTVGKEKIEKNTPVFEAQTNSDLGLKYRQISVANPYLTRMPTLTTTITNGSSVFVRGSTPTQGDFQVKQKSYNNESIDVDLRDASFIVQYDSRFLSVSGIENNVSTPSTGQNYISTVRVRQTATATDGSEGSLATFRVAVRSFTDDYYNYYATSNTSGVIISFITITGVASGASVIQQINVNKNSST